MSNEDVRLETFNRLFFGHPLIKAAWVGLLGLTGNILAGAYIFEITKTVNNVQILDWSASPYTRSFWLLLGTLVLMSVYGWGASRQEKLRIRAVLNEADVLGIALQELIGPMVDAAKKDIKDGKIRTLEDVKKMFGSEKGKTE